MSDFSASRILENDILLNPFDFYEKLTPRQPVCQIPDTNIFMVLSYDLNAEACNRKHDFTNAFGDIFAGARANEPDVKAIIDQGWPHVDVLVTADPPVHTRFRKILGPVFSKSAIDKMEPFIRGIADDLIDRIIERGTGTAEVVSDFSFPLAARVIAEQLGLEPDLAAIERWANAVTDRACGTDKAREMECAREIVEFQHVMMEKIEDRRGQPKEDILGLLVNARFENGAALTEGELMSILLALVNGGTETTTKTFAGGVLLLLTHPDQLSRIRNNLGLIPPMVEEILRLETPVGGLWRKVPRETTLGGVTIPAGSLLMMRFAAANRDTAVFAKPGEFDVERNNAWRHMAFGKGIHTCLGNMLARKELAVGYRQFFSRLNNIRLAPDYQPDWVANMNLRGLSSLNICFDK